MADRTQPIICTTQEVANYLGIPAATLALNIDAGGITLSTWLGSIVTSTAWWITTFIGKDYTNAQVEKLQFRGDGKSSGPIQVAEPIGLFSTFKAYTDDGQAVSPAVDKADLTIGPDELLQFSWSKGPFSPQVTYFVEYTRAATGYPNAATGWPLPIKQIQIEMCAIIWKESGNGHNLLGFDQTAEYPDQRVPVQVTNALKRFEHALKIYRKISV